MNTLKDTIVAPATPLLPSGVAVLRVSGPLVPVLIENWLALNNPVPRRVYKSSFSVSGKAIDEGLWIYFKAPYSYTGEDVLELFPHGSPVVMQALLDEMACRGARMAQPGEFTQRAFEAGKIDLWQAEAVRELIDAVSLEGAQAAFESLRGRVSQYTYALEKRLLSLRVLSETYLDFSDSDIEQEAFHAMKEKLASWIDEAERFAREAKQSTAFFSKLSVAILGQPNVGKSSLMNQLTQSNVSIVNARAGTTRDILKHEVLWMGRRVGLLDTAGIRETVCDIEREGIDRIKPALSEVGVILWVLDVQGDSWKSDAQAALDWLERFASWSPLIFVLNKTDARESSEPLPVMWEGYPVVAISCLQQQGIEALKLAIMAALGSDGQQVKFFANQRHVDAISEAVAFAKQAYAYPFVDECFSQELMSAHRCLMKVLGLVSSEDLLGQVFSTFCIGK